jgi:hypothetical protein
MIPVLLAPPLHTALAAACRALGEATTGDVLEVVHFI